MHKLLPFSSLIFIIKICTLQKLGFLVLHLFKCIVHMYIYICTASIYICSYLYCLCIGLLVVGDFPICQMI